MLRRRFRRRTPAAEDGGCLAQQPYRFGYESIRVLSHLVRGDAGVVPANKLLEVPTFVIKKDGVDEFRTRLKKLLAEAG